MKLKWKVSEVPTGPYRSFHKRGWPLATYEDGEVAGAIACEDEYIPSMVKSGNHKELTVRVADHSVPGRGFEWKTIKRRCATLKEAKELLGIFLEQNPNFIPEQYPNFIPAKKE